PAAAAGGLRRAANQRTILIWVDQINRMANLPTKLRPSNQRPPDFWERLKQLDRFFEGRDEVHQTMRRLVRRLAKANIAYAVVGGMAVFAQGYRRATNDVDILLTREGFAEFQRLFVPKHYGTIPNRSRRFVDRANEINVDILVTGRFPGSGKPGPIPFPDP